MHFCDGINLWTTAGDPARSSRCLFSPTWRSRHWNFSTSSVPRAVLFHESEPAPHRAAGVVDGAYAGFTSPGTRPSAAISLDDRDLTTCASLPSASAKCFAASTAFPATAMAALKYLKDGAPSKPALYRLALGDDSHDDGCPGVVTWTTQPAGGALSDMARMCAHRIVFVHSGLRGPTLAV
jgi:hypothetical protein